VILSLQSSYSEYINESTVEFKQLVNSYLVILQQSDSYMLRKGITELIVDVFDDVFVSDDDFGVLCLSKKCQFLSLDYRTLAK